MRVDAPATFSIGGLVLRDTQGLNLSEMGSVERMKSATLFLEVENLFPVDFGLDVELLDKQYYKLGDLDISPQEGILAGVVDLNGYPLQSTKSSMIIKLPREKMDMLRHAGYVTIAMYKAGLL